MRISILKLARNDLKEIRDYLSGFGENPPRKFREDFERFCSQVVEMPNMYSVHELDSNYRKAVIIYDYLVFYKVENDKAIKIYRVLHGRRNAEMLL